MEGIDILFIGIGLVCVGISFFLTEKLAGGKKKEEELLEKVKQDLKKEICQKENLDLLLEETKKELTGHSEEMIEELVLDMKDQMDRVTNEKMLAFGEYSDQVLEKIHQDHTEVVFLYDMLKEKESTLRDFAARVEGIRVQVLDLMEQAERKMKEDGVNEAVESVASIREADRQMTIDNETGKQPVKSVEGSVVDRNEWILQLHREGKSVREISKSLGLGQGEVKLVIDLFRDTK